MKRLLLSLTATLLASTAMADIQDPPMADHGPTRKLGRAWSNILYASAEIPQTMQRVTELEGDSAGATYGFVKGLHRMVVRMGTGVYELVTYPFPVYRHSYRPMTRSNVPWINRGYEEFPPEWGFQTKRRYTTTSDRY